MPIIKSISKNQITLIQETDCGYCCGGYFLVSNLDLLDKKPIQNLFKIVEIATQTLVLEKSTLDNQIPKHFRTGQDIKITKLNLDLGFIPDCLDDGNISIENLQSKTLKTHTFIPVLQNGDSVEIGQKIGFVDCGFKYWILSSYTGQIENLKLDDYNANDTVATINDDKQFQIRLSNSQSLDLTLSPKIVSVGVASIDIFYPIISGTQNLLINPPQNLVQDILSEQKENQIILHLVSILGGQLPKNQLHKNIKIVDETNLVEISVKMVGDFCNKMLGYDVLIINELGYFLPIKLINSTVIEIQKSTQKPSYNLNHYSNSIIWQGDVIDLKNSNTHNCDLEELLLDQYNIETANLYQKIQKLDSKNLSIQEFAKYPQSNTFEKLVKELNIVLEK